jgi:hypothetical protein
MSFRYADQQVGLTVAGRAAVRSRRALGAFWGVVLAVAVGAPGCNTADLQTLCEKQASCRGGSDKDIEACVVASESQETLIDDVGCSDEFVTYSDCLLDKGTCEVLAQGNPCQSHADCNGGQCTTANICEVKVFRVEGDGCDMEENAFQRCFNL